MPSTRTGLPAVDTKVPKAAAAAAVSKDNLNEIDGDTERSNAEKVQDSFSKDTGMVSRVVDVDNKWPDGAPEGGNTDELNAKTSERKLKPTKKPADPKDLQKTYEEPQNDAKATAEFTAKQTVFPHIKTPQAQLPITDNFDSIDDDDDDDDDIADNDTNRGLGEVCDCMDIGSAADTVVDEKSRSAQIQNINETKKSDLSADEGTHMADNDYTGTVVTLVRHDFEVSDNDKAATAPTEGDIVAHSKRLCTDVESDKLALKPSAPPDSGVNMQCFRPPWMGPHGPSFYPPGISSPHNGFTPSVLGSGPYTAMMGPDSRHIFPSGHPGSHNNKPNSQMELSPHSMTPHPMHSAWTPHYPPGFIPTTTTGMIDGRVTTIVHSAPGRSNIFKGRKRKKSLVAAKPRKKRNVTKDERWRDFLYGLKIYREKHGDYCVRMNTDARLHHWFYKQRLQWRAYKAGEQHYLRDSWIEELKAMDFDRVIKELDLSKTKLDAIPSLPATLESDKSKAGDAADLKKRKSETSTFGEKVSAESIVEKAESRRCKVNNETPATKAIEETGEVKFSGDTTEGNISSESAASGTAADNDVASNSKRRQNWMDRFVELRKFKEENGHFIVRQTENPKLTLWVRRQHKQLEYFEEGDRCTLDADLIEKLRLIGFTADTDVGIVRSTSTKKKKKKIGGLDVDSDDDDGSEDLIYQKSARSRCSRRDQKWYDRLDELKDYKDENGDLRINQSTNPALYSWVKRQKRQLYELKSGGVVTLDSDMVKELQNIGLDPDFDGRRKKAALGGSEDELSTYLPDQFRVVNRTTSNVPTKWEQNWIDKYEELKAYKEKHRDIKVKQVTNPSLQNWITRQREQLRQLEDGQNCVLLEDWVPLLHDLGIHPRSNRSSVVKVEPEETKVAPTPPAKMTFSERLVQLKRHKEAHGSFVVDNEKDPVFAKWVKEQRRQYRLNKNGKSCALNQDALTALDEMGFGRDEYWLSLEDSLCIKSAPRKSPQSIEEATAKRKSDAAYVSAKLEENEEAPEVAQHDQIWYDFLVEMREYKAEHGTVHFKRTDNPKLFDWFQRQQHALKLFEEDKAVPIRNEWLEELQVLVEESAPEGDKSESDLNNGLDISDTEMDGADSELSTTPNKKKARLSFASRSDRSSIVSTPGRKERALSDSVQKHEQNWLKRLEELNAYKVEHGNVNVRSDHSLYEWLRRQRCQLQLLREGKRSPLKQRMVEELKKLGVDQFVHTTRASAGDAWNTMISALQAFKDEFGHCDVPQTYPSNQKLSRWVCTQRWRYKCIEEGKQTCMTQEQINQLEGMGFPWISKNWRRQVKWDQRFEELKEYHAEHGHCDTKPDENKELSQWVRSQRAHYLHMSQGKSHSLTDERIQQLNDLNFDWVGRCRQTPWRDRIAQLREFKSVYGDVQVPKKFRPNPSLGAWVDERRRYYKRYIEGRPSPLTDEQIIALDKLGFVWSFKGKQYSPWEKKYRDLIEYKQEHGDCLVPEHYEHNRRLGEWVTTQLENYHALKEGEQSDMTTEQMGLLDKLEFTKPGWRAFVEDLKRYKVDHGDCLVPLSWSTDRTHLGSWVSRQRAQYHAKLNGNQSSLTDEKIDELNELKFVWVAEEETASQRRRTASTWHDRIEELLEYKEKHGHLQVPKSHDSLGRWVHTKRQQYKSFIQGKPSPLTEDKIQDFINIGFVFSSGYEASPAPAPPQRLLRGSTHNHSSNNYDQGTNLQGMNVAGMNVPGMNMAGFSAINSQSMGGHVMGNPGLNAQNMATQGLNPQGLGGQSMGGQGMMGQNQSLSSQVLGGQGLSAQCLTAQGLGGQGLNSHGLTAQGMSLQGMQGMSYQQQRRAPNMQNTNESNWFGQFEDSHLYFPSSHGSQLI